MNTPKSCLVCQLMMTPTPPTTILRWEGTKEYEGFAVTLAVCERHQEQAPDEKKLHTLIEELVGLRKEG